MLRPVSSLSPEASILFPSDNRRRQVFIPLKTLGRHFAAEAATGTKYLWAHWFRAWATLDLTRVGDVRSREELHSDEDSDPRRLVCKAANGGSARGSSHREILAGGGVA